MPPLTNPSLEEQRRIATMNPGGNYNPSQLTEMAQKGITPPRPTLYDATGLAKTPYDEFTKPVDENRIREDILKSQQSVFQAIKDASAAELSRRLAVDEEMGQSNAARVRAVNVSSGLAGSNIASSNAAQDETNTRRVKEATTREVTAQRDKEIQTILGRANERADAMIEAAKMQRLGAIEKSQGYLEKIQNEARADIELIAKSGSASLEQFKNSSAFQGYLEQTGWTPAQLELRYNAALPKAQASDFRFEKVGDNMLVWQFDPATGEFKRREDMDYSTPTGTAGKYKEMTTPDGTVLLIPEKIDPTKSLDEQVLKYGSEGQYAKPEDTGGFTP